MTPKDLEALRLLAAAEARDPPGLAESNVTDDELGTIYHHTARRLATALPPLALASGTDRYVRPLFRITPQGLDQLRTLTTTKDTSSCS